MKIKVLYHSKTGNTKKIADAIADAVGAKSELINENTSIDNTDMLFIGDGIYGGKTNPQTDKFLRTLNSSKIKNVAVFGTYGGQTTAITKMKGLLNSQGISVIDETFGCKGKMFFIFNRKHPDAKDLGDAKTYAKRVLKSIK